MTAGLARWLQGPAETPISLTPFAAAEMVELFGWLSGWWLERAVVETASRYQPAYRRYAQRGRLPSKPGGCWALYVNVRRLPHLQPAFLLPLSWRLGGTDDPCLPHSLLEVARTVRRQFPDNENFWGLHLERPEREKPIDLSEVDATLLTSDSAWASLAGGYLLARDGLCPDTHVWASAAWDSEYGIARVEGMAAKLDLARQWGVQQIFVPAQNQPDVSQQRSLQLETMTIRFLQPVNHSPQPQRLLESYLDELGVEPLPEQSEDLQRRYYARVSRARARDFYWRRLLPQAIDRCRALNDPACQPTHLVTVVGLEASITAMASLALRVQQCLLLYREPAPHAILKVVQTVSDLLSQKGITVKVEGFTSDSRDAELTEMQRCLKLFADVHPGQLTVDLTPGFKSASLALMEAAPTGAWLLYCRHEQMGADNRVVPGSERYDCWRKV